MCLGTDEHRWSDIFESCGIHHSDDCDATTVTGSIHLTLARIHSCMKVHCYLKLSILLLNVILSWQKVAGCYIACLYYIIFFFQGDESN